MKEIIKPKVESTFSLLLENYNKELTIKAISEVQDIPYTTAFEVMNSLATRNIVKKERKGKAHTYRINLKSDTTKALLNMGNTLRLDQAKISINLPKDIKVDFLILYNGKKVGVNKTSQTYEMKGFDFITTTALKNTLQKKPKLLNAITVPIGFDKYYSFLSELETSTGVKEDKTKDIEKLETKMNEALEMMAICIKKKDYTLAFESMYDAIRFNTKALGLKNKVKVNGRYYDYLRKTLTKNKKLIDTVETGFSKVKEKLTAKDLTVQFKNVEKLLEAINAAR